MTAKDSPFMSLSFFFFLFFSWSCRKGNDTKLPGHWICELHNMQPELRCCQKLSHLVADPTIRPYGHQ